MIDGESARTAIVPIESRADVAGETGIEMGGTGDAADDVNDSFVIIHAADGCMRCAAQFRARNRQAGY